MTAKIACVNIPVVQLRRAICFAVFPTEKANIVPSCQLLAILFNIVTPTQTQYSSILLKTMNNVDKNHCEIIGHVCKIDDINTA